MVSLGVGRQVSEGDKLQPQGTWIDTMLQNALWLPDNPPRNLFFNEGSLSRGDLLVPGYRPIIWNLFGGEDGSRLSSLVQLITIVDKNRLQSIQFVHRTSRTRAGSKKRYNGYLDVGNHPQPSSYRSFGTQCVFDIDGPGGERITDITAVVREKPNEVQSRYFDRGVPLYYRVSYFFLTP